MMMMMMMIVLIILIENDEKDISKKEQITRGESIYDVKNTYLDHVITTIAHSRNNCVSIEQACNLVVACSMSQRLKRVLLQYEGD